MSATNLIQGGLLSAVALVVVAYLGIVSKRKEEPHQNFIEMTAELVRLRALLGTRDVEAETSHNALMVCYAKIQVLTIGSWTLVAQIRRRGEEPEWTPTTP